jgi:hypothetical protein
MLEPFPRSAGDHPLPLWREFGKSFYFVWPEPGFFGAWNLAMIATAPANQRQRHRPP